MFWESNEKKASKILTKAQKEKDSEKKISLLYKAIKIDSKLLLSYNLLVEIFIEDQKYEISLELLSRVFKQTDSNSRAFYNRGLIYYNQGKKEKAEIDINRAIELGYIDAYYLRASILFEKERYNGSIQDLQKIVNYYNKIQSNSLRHYKVYYLLSKNLVKIKNWGKAKYITGICLKSKNDLFELYLQQILINIKILDQCYNDNPYKNIDDIKKFIKNEAESFRNSKLYIKPEIKDKHITNAINSYASSLSKKDILVLCDCTVWGSAKNGFIITKQGIFFKELMGKPYKLIFSKVFFPNLSVDKKKMVYSDISHETLHDFNSILIDDMRNFVNFIITIFTSNIISETKELFSQVNNMEAKRNPEYYEQRYYFFMKMEQFDKAIDDINILESLTKQEYSNKKSLILFKKASKEYSEDNFRKATSNFKLALKFDPTIQKANESLAEIQINERNYTLAIQYYEKELALCNNESYTSYIEDKIFYCNNKITADQGDALSQNNLGLIYLQGKCIEQNNIKALEYFKLSASQGCPEAQYNLGKLYSEQNDDESQKKFIKYVELSANQGYVLAQCELGKILLSNDEIENAIINFTLSADKGNELAQYLLGKIFFRDRYFEKNKLKCKFYLNMAAKQRNKNAIELLKVYPIRVAAIEGVTNAIYEYSQIEFNGDNDDISINRYELLLSAAEDGHSEAQYQVGRKLNGLFASKKKNTEAKKWLQLAASQNHDGAKSLLKTIKKKESVIQFSKEIYDDAKKDVERKQNIRRKLEKKGDAVLIDYIEKGSGDYKSLAIEVLRSRGYDYL